MFPKLKIGLLGDFIPDFCLEQDLAGTSSDCSVRMVHAFELKSYWKSKRKTIIRAIKDYRVGQRHEVVGKLLSYASDWKSLSDKFLSIFFDQQKVKEFCLLVIDITSFISFDWRIQF